MISDIVFCVAVVTMVVAFSEIFLSEQQKGWLDKKVVQLWSWLDDCKRVSLLVWLRKLTTPRVLAVALLLSCGFVFWVWQASPTPRGDPTEFYGTIVVLLIIASILGALIIRSALKSTTLPRALLRITIYAILCVAPFHVFLYWTSSHQALLTVRPITVLQLLWVLAFFAVIIFTAFLLIFWSSVAVPIICLYVIRLLLLVSEFAVRRIAEYPRGVLIAVGVLMASLFGFVRVFK